ncbi:MAG: Mth938-like domain-containing protein [bacterium]
MNISNTIEHYSFGSMKINGKLYQKDLIVFPDRIVPGWWRRQGHFLALEDLGEIVNFNPDMLIVGTGSSGMMQIPETTRKELQERNITLVAELTDKAVDIFNEQIERGRKAAGAFHLTC